MFPYETAWLILDPTTNRLIIPELLVEKTKHRPARLRIAETLKMT
jgi:hypothetical protein